MKSYSTFIFDSYAWDPDTGTVKLRYSLDDEVKCVETLKLPPPDGAYDVAALDRALFALHLIGGISYYKTCLPKTMEIRSGELNEEQAAFWNSVYENGLGEFFYRNDIDFRGLINFPITESPTPQAFGTPEAEEKKAPRVLVPVGGGKDSIVTVELLKKAGMDCTLYRNGAHPFITRLVDVVGLPLLTAERSLPKELFALNAQGALNGHIPVTAYLSFLTIALSVLHNFDAVAMSNERSANVGNVEFHGMEINHQWSKSVAFEKGFQDYVTQWMTPYVTSFSLLRPMSELHIAKIFSGYPQYFPVTTSCNANWKILQKNGALTKTFSPGAVAWCGHCPKCAFVFALMSAFIPASAVIQMFGGQHLYANEELRSLYRELLGLQGFKPFECVGTPEETKAAFVLAHQRGDMEDTAIMKMFVQEALPSIKHPDQLIDECLTPSTDHAIPAAFLSVLPRNRA